MAMTRMQPIEVQVRTDWLSGSPREIRLRDHVLPVTRVAAVRRETAAYPMETGPRTTFEVDTPEARIALSFRHRGRRWVVEGYEVPARRLA